MNIDALADALRREYYDASAEKGKATSALLFGVRYADFLSGETIDAIVSAAGLPESYRADVRKGARMARYVTLRDVDSGGAGSGEEGSAASGGTDAAPTVARRGFKTFLLSFPGGGEAEREKGRLGRNAL
ncbi:hypothetical protein Sa4125_04540 [Aureimonas sp. SA4125]|uniref:HTH-like domain-containing protein n=1 Tax=Aureimonas sp. SA4125 TaxID=2826993 RepID=UPI001CC64F48|nr:hypothetical protein [Aureimonas sp. SA4125]BDA82912.1 hypothetical protein Sa4125_04540 [Aureimonas sp. SA4125]